MKTKTLLIAIILLACKCPAPAQIQEVFIKTNALYWATTTPNVAAEVALNPKTSLDLAVGYNRFSFNDNKMLRHYLVQPEVRYWFYECFTGMFAGAHLHGGAFNVSGIGPFTKLKENRHEGYFYGAGISIGNQWLLNDRFALEAEFGLGYARVEYDKYRCDKCSAKTGSGHHNYFGPTRLSFSLVYLLWNNI